MSISTEKMLQYLFLMEQYRIFVPQRRNIMVLFIISYLLKEQIVGGRNFHSQAQLRVVKPKFMLTNLKIMFSD